ncbi:hypothetical protein ACFQZ4_49830 [Catellatospora coxensis]
MRRALIKLAIQVALILTLSAIFVTQFAGAIFTTSGHPDASEPDSLTMAYRSDQVEGVLVGLQVSAQSLSMTIEVVRTGAVAFDHDGEQFFIPVFLTATGSGRRVADCFTHGSGAVVSAVPQGSAAQQMLADAQRVRSQWSEPQMSALQINVPFNHSQVLSRIGVTCDIAPEAAVTRSQARRDVRLPAMTVAGMLMSRTSIKQAQSAPTSLCVTQELRLAASEQIDTLAPSPAVTGDGVWNELWPETAAARTAGLTTLDDPAASNIWRSCSAALDCPMSFLHRFGRCATG